MMRVFPSGSHPNAPCSEKLVIPNQKNLTRPGFHPEIEHGHSGGINTAFIPSVDDLLDVVLFAAPYKKDRFLRSLVLVAGRDLDAFEFHFPPRSRFQDKLRWLFFFNETHMKGKVDIIKINENHMLLLQFYQESFRLPVVGREE